MNEDFLVSAGGALKSLSDSGKFGGYLILFDVVDLENERFAKSGSYWLDGRDTLPLLYDHGRSREFGKRRITNVKTTTQDQGIYVEGTLPLAASWQVEQLWEGIKGDKLGLSSGSSSHLVEKRRVGDVVEITHWPVIEASITLTPANPRSRAMALKSLPASDFELLPRSKNLAAEARAREIYMGMLSPEERAREIHVELVKSRYEGVMREFERSQHADAKAEEYDYYNALAQLEIEKYELRRRQLERKR